MSVPYVLLELIFTAADTGTVFSSASARILLHCSLSPNSSSIQTGAQHRYGYYYSKTPSLQAQLRGVLEKVNRDTYTSTDTVHKTIMSRCYFFCMCFTSTKSENANKSIRFWPREESRGAIRDSKSATRFAGQID